MWKLVLSIPFVVLLLAAAPAQENALPDTEKSAKPVWREATFGMTPDEVLAAFPKEARRSSDSEFPIEIRSIPDLVGFKALFRFKAKKLVEIRLEKEVTVRSGESAFNAMLAPLTEKYGKPISETKENKPGNKYWVTTWNTPGASIGLTLYVISSELLQSATMYVSYSPRDTRVKSL